MRKLFFSLLLTALTLTYGHAVTIEETIEEVLINGGSYDLSGTFGSYDFEPKGDKNKFDWAYTTADGVVYQMGVNISDNNVFGFAKAPAGTPSPAPAWYMFQVDVDGDGMGRFDWVLLGANSNYATKLKGVAANGSFDYTGKIDIDYNVNGSNIATYSLGGAPSNEITAEFSSSKSIASTKQTVIEIAGQNNDHLSISVAKLPFGQAEDLTVGFKLIYTDANVLPRITIDTDIDFDTAATLKFRSDNLSGGDTMLVYHGATQDYFVPFVKNGNTYTATLLHFSNYGFDGRPSKAALINDIELGLSQLKSYTGDEGIYGLDSNLIGDIVSKINALEAIDSTLNQNYMEQLIAIINAAVDRWMIKMKQITPTYWNGYCIHDDFKAYVTKLAQTMMELELCGGKSIDADVNSLINKHMKAAYEEWKTITPPTPCDIGNMLKYIQCAVKFATEAELAGVNISGNEQMDILKNYVENNVLYVISHASCPQLECVKYYLTMSQNHEFEYMGLESDYTQELQAKVDELEEKIDNDTCESTLWRLHVNFVIPSLMSGTVTYKNFTLDCDDPIENDPFFGDVCAYLSTSDYTDVRMWDSGKPSLAEASYGGSLAVDSDLEPLMIYSKGVVFNALNTSQSGEVLPQVGSQVWEYHYNHGPIDSCFGNFAADTLSNIKAGKKSEWSSMSKGDGYAYCDFVLEPCKDENCNAY
jgi:hypothetical protein